MLRGISPATPRPDGGRGRASARCYADPERYIPRLRQWLLRTVYLCAAVLLCLQPLGYAAYTSYLLYPIFGLSFLLWLSVLWPRPERLDLLVLLMAAVALVAVVVNGIAAGAAFTVSYLKKYLLFLFTLLFLAAADRLRKDRRTDMLLFGLQLMVSLCFFGALVVRREEMYRLDGDLTRLLTLGFTSSQLAALFLTCEIFFFLLAAARAHSVGLRLVSAAAAVLNAVLLAATRCRTALVAVVAFLVVCLLRCLCRRWRRPLRRGTLALFAIAPLPAAAVYGSLVTRPWLRAWLSFMESEGKPLDSRLDIWRQGVSLLRESPFVGAYCEAGNGTGVFQLHNTHLDTAVSYGLPVMLLLCAFLYCLLRRTQAGAGARPASALAFAGVILLGAGEAALVSGGLVFYLYAGLFLLREEQPGEDGMVAK